MMQYVGAGVWFAIGLVLMIFMGRRSKLYIGAGAIFFLMGVWWLIQAIFSHVAWVTGWLGWVVKIILALALIGLCIAFFRERRSGGE